MRTYGHFESTSGQKKSGADKDVICSYCKEPSHYKNEYPKLKKENPKE